MASDKDRLITIDLFIELKSRLTYALIFLLIIFAICLFFANQLYTFLAQPLLKFLPQKHLIATQIVSSFFVPFKLAFMVSVAIAIPFVLYQVWAFIAPALYGREKKIIWPFIFLSSLLFYIGIIFTYSAIFPILFKFLVGTAPKGVILSPDINEYLDFTIKLMFTFGLLFEIPIVMFLLVSAKIMSQSKLKSMRSYAIVGAFILGMLFAPPDIFSQIILAVPIWLLYELGLGLCWLLEKNRDAKA